MEGWGCGGEKPGSSRLVRGVEGEDAGGKAWRTFQLPRSGIESFRGRDWEGIVAQNTDRGRKRGGFQAEEQKE